MFIYKIWLFDGYFPQFRNLICRSTDISKCFRGSLRLRDNESRLYVLSTSSANNIAILPTVSRSFHLIFYVQRSNDGIRVTSRKQIKRIVRKATAIFG